MDNFEHRQAIQRLMQRCDADAIRELAAALDDPATSYIALHALKHCGTAEATDAVLKRLVTAQRSEEQVQNLLEDLDNRMPEPIIHSLEQGFGRLPLEALLTIALAFTDAEYATFQRWRVAQEKPLRTVVTVDDELGGCALMQLIVNLSGDLVMVGVAHNGREGIDMARRLQPDVIIVDHMMPHMDGLEAMPHIRQVAPHTRIIFRTYAYSDQGLRGNARASGANEVMDYGPLQREEVLAVIRRAVYRD